MKLKTSFKVSLYKPCFWVCYKEFNISIEYSQKILICPQQRTVGDCVSFASTVMLNQFGWNIKQLLVQRGFLIVNNNEDMDINIVGYIIILLHQYQARACYSRNCNSTINKVIKDCPHFKYQIVVILLRFNTSCNNNDDYVFYRIKSK